MFYAYQTELGPLTQIFGTVTACVLCCLRNRWHHPGFESSTWRGLSLGQPISNKP